jgi:hypothetical protein
VTFASADGSTRFASTSLDWLVVAGRSAQVGGVGRLNGVGGHRFQAWVTDAASGADSVRVRILDATGAVAYDSGFRPLATGWFTVRH